MTRRAVAIVVTSGTAAAELTAAVVEADLAGVPLVVVTADRPPELRGVGAPQTIDQVKLFGAAVRRVRGPRHDPSGLGAVVARARVPAPRPPRSTGRGPVHLNVPLVEPLDAAASAIPRGAGERRAVADRAPLPSGPRRRAFDLPRCGARPARRGPRRGRPRCSCSTSRRTTAGRCSPTRSRAPGSSTRASSTTFDALRGDPSRARGAPARRRRDPRGAAGLEVARRRPGRVGAARARRRRAGMARRSPWARERRARRVPAAWATAVARARTARCARATTSLRGARPTTRRSVGASPRRVRPS